MERPNFDQKPGHDVIDWPQERLEERINVLLNNLGNIAYTAARREQVEGELELLDFEDRARRGQFGAKNAKS
jgi:hypothetical protein